MFKKFFRKLKFNFSRFNTKNNQDISSKFIIAASGIQMIPKDQKNKDISSEIIKDETQPEDFVKTGYLSLFIDCILLSPLVFLGWKTAILAYFLVATRDYYFSFGNYLLGIQLMKKDGSKVTLVDSLNKNVLSNALFWWNLVKVTYFYSYKYFIAKEVVNGSPSVFSNIDLFLFYLLGSYHLYNFFQTHVKGRERIYNYIKKV